VTQAFALRSIKHLAWLPSSFRRSKFVQKNLFSKNLFEAKATSNVSLFRMLGLEQLTLLSWHWFGH